MFLNRFLIKKLNKNLEKINNILEKDNISDLILLLGSKKQIFIRNLLAGITRGIGIGIGVTIVTALIVIFLQKLVRLNLPIIGDYLVDIINIVNSKI